MALSVPLLFRATPRAAARGIAEPGALVIPIGDGQLLQGFQDVGGALRAEWLSGCRFVPLVGAQEEQAGQEPSE
jgi:protein-L-isoaspartate O-methyltransferase